MGQIFDFVGQTLVRAIPTFIFVFLLYFYLKKYFFGPIGAVLEKRRLATEGAVEKADAMVAHSAEKLAVYEQALTDARAAAFKESEALRAQLRADQAKAVDHARQGAAATLASAKADLAKQAESSRAYLESESERLAEQIANSILGGRAA